MKTVKSAETPIVPTERMTRAERRAWYHANRKKLKLPSWWRLGELAPAEAESRAVADDPVFAYARAFVDDVREAQASVAREVVLTYAAMAGIPAIVGLIYWYL